MIYTNIPKKFNPRFEVVSCYVENDGNILMLHRHDHKSEGNKWGVPAGKMDKGENELQAIIREVEEETGQKLDSKNLEYLIKVYVKYPEYHFIYHMFRVVFVRKPKIKLSFNEHKGYRWVSPRMALELNLVRDLDRCIKMFY